jgi:hypothetical protein
VLPLGALGFIVCLIFIAVRLRDKKVVEQPFPNIPEKYNGFYNDYKKFFEDGFLIGTDFRVEKIGELVEFCKSGKKCNNYRTACHPIERLICKDIIAPVVAEFGARFLGEFYINVPSKYRKEEDYKKYFKNNEVPKSFFPDWIIETKTNAHIVVELDGKYKVKQGGPDYIQGQKGRKIILEDMKFKVHNISWNNNFNEEYRKTVYTELSNILKNSKSDTVYMYKNESYSDILGDYSKLEDNSWCKVNCLSWVRRNPNEYETNTWVCHNGECNFAKARMDKEEELKTAVLNNFQGIQETFLAIVKNAKPGLMGACYMFFVKPYVRHVQKIKPERSRLESYRQALKLLQQDAAAESNFTWLCEKFADISKAYSKAYSEAYHDLSFKRLDECQNLIEEFCFSQDRQAAFDAIYARLEAERGNQRPKRPG